MNKLNAIAAFVMLGLALSSAQAQGPAGSALEKSLLESGYVALSDGLYADSSVSGKALVATNAAGHTALADQLQADHAQDLRIAQKDGVSRSEQRVLDSLLSKIQSLRQAATTQAKITQSNFGACLTPNGATLYASSSSSNGTSASATAVNALDFGPITPTDNYAEAGTEFSSNSGYGVGASPANASASQAQSCFAYGYGSVTCPGENAPGVSAYASSLGRARRCLY